MAKPTQRKPAAFVRPYVRVLVWSSFQPRVPHVMTRVERHEDGSFHRRILTLTRKALERFEALGENQVFHDEALRALPWTDRALMPPPTTHELVAWHSSQAPDRRDETPAYQQLRAELFGSCHYCGTVDSSVHEDGSCDADRVPRASCDDADCERQHRAFLSDCEDSHG
jgi:hypothetical protein